MNKELRFICSQPDDSYYIWQVHLWLESLKNLGQSDKATVLIFTPSFRVRNENWKDLVELYPESEFVFYKDEDGSITNLIRIYIPIIRPYSLMRYFNDNPDMKNKAVFYCDSDVIFTEQFNIDAYLDDDVCYLSDTNSYINARYFDSKKHDVKADKLAEYEKRDILQEITTATGISREIAEKYNEHSGGAQYLLKNIDGAFWEKVLNDCITIRVFLREVNDTYFENENKGFQSWCADMWAVLWNVWYRKQETVVIKELEFAWSSDSIKKLDRVGILHNAGIVSNSQGDIPTFYKGYYHNGKNPFDDPHVHEVLNNEKSKTLCNHYYVTKMFEIKNKYNLNY
jgi:hypothetical protein